MHAYFRYRHWSYMHVRMLKHRRNSIISQFHKHCNRPTLRIFLFRIARATKPFVDKTKILSREHHPARAPSSSSTSSSQTSPSAIHRRTTILLDFREGCQQYHPRPEIASSIRRGRSSAHPASASTVGNSVALLTQTYASGSFCD